VIDPAERMRPLLRRWVVEKLSMPDGEQLSFRQDMWPNLSRPPPHALANPQ
jgi:hypothetical protein